MGLRKSPVREKAVTRFLLQVILQSGNCQLSTKPVTQSNDPAPPLLQMLGIGKINPLDPSTHFLQSFRSSFQLGQILLKAIGLGRCLKG